jgi:hypothetical protein
MPVSRRYTLTWSMASSSCGLDAPLHEVGGLCLEESRRSDRTRVQRHRVHQTFVEHRIDKELLGLEVQVDEDAAVHVYAVAVLLPDGDDDVAEHLQMLPLVVHEVTLVGAGVDVHARGSRFNAVES